MTRLVLTTLAALLLLAPPAAAAEELAVAPGRIVADAYGGRVAWAQYDPSAKQWRLVEHRSGRVRRLPVNGFEEPVRIDLGPGPDGGVVAVYAREGRLFLFDFDTRKERFLVEFGAGSLPSVWRGELLFSRREGREFSLWRGKFGTGRLRKLPGGPVSGVSGPIATELRGARAVFVWSSGATDRRETGLYEVRDGRAVRLDRTGSGGAGATTFVTPEIYGRRVYYGRATTGTGQQIRRVSLRTGRVEVVRAPFGPLVSAVWEGKGRFLLSRAFFEREPGPDECGMRADGDLSESVCRLVRTDPMTGWTAIRSRVAH